MAEPAFGGSLSVLCGWLEGFAEAIGAVYPHSQVQRCIVHQIRSSTRFVSYKDIKPLMADLKKVYTAVTEEEALEHLMTFKENWGETISLLCQKLGGPLGYFEHLFRISHRNPENHIHHQYHRGPEPSDHLNPAVPRTG